MKNKKKGKILNENDFDQIIDADKPSYRLTEVVNGHVRTLQKGGVKIQETVANKIIDFFIKHFLGLNIEVIQRVFFDGMLDVIGTKKLDNRTGKESITSKCRLLWMVFEHTHGSLHHKVGAKGRSPDDLNRDVLLKIVQVKRRKSLVG